MIASDETPGNEEIETGLVCGLCGAFSLMRSLAMKGLRLDSVLDSVSLLGSNKIPGNEGIDTTQSSDNLVESRSNEIPGNEGIETRKCRGRRCAGPL